MATSTSTLLQVANRAFLNANERPLTTMVTATNLLIGQQMLECIRAAYYKIMREGEWLWTNVKINASSWSSEAATLPTSTQRVKLVVWQNDATDYVRIPLTFLTISEFDEYVLDTYNSTTLPGRALYWTLTDYNVARINPYPTDATEQGRIFFHCNTIPTFPSTDAGTFSLPEDFIPLLVLITTAMYIKRHGDDATLARSFEEEYMIELAQLRARQLLTPNNSINMYRRRRYSSNGFF